jgi:hypothetical protein
VRAITTATRSLLGDEPIEHGLVDRVARVISGSLGWRADDREHLAGLDPELPRDRGVGDEVAEVVVLLQPGVAEDLPRRRPGAAHRLHADRVGRQHPAGGPEGELALEPRVLVILHLHRADPKRGADDREVDGPVGEREPEPAPARPGGERPAAAGKRQSLARGGASPVLADDLVGEAEPVEDADRLAVLARRDLDLVPAAAQALDDRPHDERMRRGRAVDPDPHRAAKLTCSGRFARMGEVNRLHTGGPNE